MASPLNAHTSSMNSQIASYTLRTLLKDIPLKEDPDSSDDVYITTVDTWEGNLYVGTSAAELLHFVSIPPAEPDQEPVWILASRQQPPYSSEQEGTERGVKQILILPSAGKACVVCNGTLTFYTLPELSPAYGGRIKQAGCTWVGGLNLSETSDQTGGSVVIICLRQRLRLITIGDEARKIRDIELGNVGAIQRRGDLACVADGHSYSLLDVVNQRRNELFPIASSSVSVARTTNQNLTPSHPPRQQSRSFSTASPIRLNHGHERNTSLGSNTKRTDRLHPDGAALPSRVSSSQASSGESTPARAQSPARDSSASALSTQESQDRLPPNIVSPSINEFLLTTGTKYDEPGVGLFVNLEGDVVRGTIEFSSYPESLVLDEAANDSEMSVGTFVLALLRDSTSGTVIELQRLHEDPTEVQRSRQHLPLPGNMQQVEIDKPLFGTGLRIATSTTTLNTLEVSQTLRQRRLRSLDGASHEADGTELKRNEEEDKFASRFAAVSSRVLVFGGSQIAWVVRSSIVTRLSAALEQAVVISEAMPFIDTTKVQSVLNSIRGQEATNELEFVTLTYIRQKASLLLFGHLLLQTSQGIEFSTQEMHTVSRSLEEGDLDPRILLSLISMLRQEIRYGSQGMWLAQGLQETVSLLSRTSSNLEAKPDRACLQILKTYLLFWRRKKGFGSVVDEALVFQSVDAALIHILLLLDEKSPRGPAIAGSVRAELNELVDKGVDCFDRAVELFVQFKRIYMLSRLYQSRKMSAQVLGCWQRVLEGEYDAGGELIDGQNDLRRYLARLRDRDLVIEYGTWLASNDSKLGARLFADETARVTFTPSEAVSILTEKAPGAVKDFLEYLVFGKNHVQYVNDLISFYLSTILSELTDPASQATATLLQSTETYRALQPPKPTFSDFITDNAVPAEWWSNRLRLLQLIGGSHGAASRYDVHALRTQLEPHSDALVPEMIILNGREGKHMEAIHLLVAGLGDYDTAIRYCLLGGSSIFHPTSSTAAQRPPLPSREEQSQLFQHLLLELLRLDDVGERLERTSELLERFGGWFDIAEVLSIVPAEWTVDVVSGFLVSAFRRLVQERNESSVAKALAGAQNLRTCVTVIEKLEGLAPVLLTEETPSLEA